MAWTIKQHDTRPKYIAALKDKFGTPSVEPIDLTNATSVDFIMRAKSATDASSTGIRAEADITDAVNGIVTYTWDPTDTAAVGSYNVEFEITWNDGGVETVPNDGYMEVEVVDDLG